MPAPTPELAASIALFTIAATEALPFWGRWIPGHLGLALVAAIAVATARATPWLAGAAFAGAVFSDLVSYAWMRMRPMHGLVHRRAWWRAGLDVDDLGPQLRRAPLRTFVVGKFSTRERARLPYAAEKAGFGWPTFACLSVAGSLAWAPAWVLVGALVGGATLVLPDEADFVILAASLLALSVSLSSSGEAERAA